MKENYNNEIVVLKGPDRIRKRPSVVFGHQGNKGVERYINTLNDIFVVEASLGFANKLEITLYGDDSVEITSYGSAILLSEEIRDGKPGWYDLLCEIHTGPKFASPTEAEDILFAHNFLFGRESEEKSGIMYGPQFDLCCVQYASEYMQFESVYEGESRSIEFSRGYAVSELKKEKCDKEPYTRIRCKPDRAVFGDYDSMKVICDYIIKSTSVRLPELCIAFQEES